MHFQWLFLSLFLTYFLNSLLLRYYNSLGNVFPLLYIFKYLFYVQLSSSMTMSVALSFSFGKLFFVVI